MDKTFYLTAAIPYVNAKPHLGHLLEWFQADSIARYQRLLGKNVAFTCGTDENSLKNIQAAQSIGQPIQDWLDEYATLFQESFERFDVSLTHFRRGSDQKQHWPGVQQLWQRCVEADDMYQKEYTGHYCVGCEAFYTEDELVDGLCPTHQKAPEVVTERNYFFRLSMYQQQITDLITSDRLAIKDEHFKNEMLGFINQGLEDFSVSRSVARARGVGVPVPGDQTQVMYVWFDALAIYLTAIGFGTDNNAFETFWPAQTHIIGKDILRFHAVYWIGMLLSANLPTPESISVHGFITLNGQKMSKSLGNVVDPDQLVAQHGLEPIRYYLLRAIPTHGDGDYSHERFVDLYTAELANGLGNLCSRVAKLAQKNELAGVSYAQPFAIEFTAAMDNGSLDSGLDWINQQIAGTDAWLAQEKPWAQEGEKQLSLVKEAVERVVSIVAHLSPFLPQTCEKLQTHFSQPKITALEPLFPRLTVSK